MDQDDLRDIIEMLEEWKIRNEREGWSGEARGLQMAINALSHFVEE